MLSVLAIPAFQDNYLWLIHDGVHAAVVDPGDAAPVLAALAKHRLSLVAILLTHHHADHVGGVPELLRNFKVPVFGPHNESIPDITNPVAEGDEVSLPRLPLQLDVLEVPGHTLDHIAYFSPQQQWLFCGDTLFAGGCGRLFEGTPAQMVTSLAKLTALPDSTQVYCAHEYTMSNLRFAQAVDPNNADLATRVPVEQAKRDQGIPTVPTTIATEKATNPFLRHTEDAILSRLADSGFVDSREPVAAFAALRQWKNTFR
jgi:hydroxyacylglutathione hydrolase